MSKPEGVITIGKLDDEQLRSGIKTLVTEIKDAVSEMAKATETATSSMEKSLKKIISVNNMMIDEFKKTREESKKTKNTLDANKQTIDNLKLRLERGLKLKADTTDLDELNGKLNQVRLALGKLKAMDALRPTQIVAYEAAIERLEKKIKSLTDAQDPAVQKAQANADRIRNALDKAMSKNIDTKNLDDVYKKWFSIKMSFHQGLHNNLFSYKEINRYTAVLDKLQRKMDELRAKEEQTQQGKETPMAQNAIQAAMSYNRLAQSMARVNAIDNLTKPNTELQKLNEQLRQGNSLLQQRERELARTTQRPIIKGEDDLTGAFGVKSARESFLAFQQGFKQQAEAVAKQIQEAEQALNTAVGKRVTDIESKITTTKQKISELNLEITKQKELQQQTGNYSQYNASLARSRQELEVQLDRLRRLQEELAKAPDTFKQSDAGQQMIQQINHLRAEHERLLNVMKDEANVSTQQVTTTQQQAQATQQVTKELENQKKSGPVFVLGPGMSQLAEVGSMRQVTEEELKQKEAKELQAYYDRQLLESSQQRVGVEHQLTTESKEQKQNKNAQKPQGDVDAYRESIAKLLGVQKNEVILAEQMVDSTKRHQASLKQLKEAYDKLPRARKDSDFGKALLTDINITERSIAQLRKQASRPIDLKAAMGGSEKTIDDISYKIQRLKQYLSGLDYTKQANEIKQVNSEIDRLNKKLNQQFGQNQKLEKSNNALARSWNYMKNRLAFYFTVGASTAFVKNLIEIRSQYELTERALGILIDSAQRGSQIFRELSEMALKSPYTLIDLSGAAKQLSAYDIAARDIVDTTRRLADITAAVGIPIDRLTYALGQIKAYGYLNARDARMFSNAGIPLVRNLADMYSQLEGRLVSVSDVYDRIKKKSIDETDVLKVIYQMTDEGGKFFNFQEKAADTLKVQLANLNLAWNNMLNDLGKSHQTLIEAPIGALKTLFKGWETIYDIVTKVIYAFGAYKATQLVINALTGVSAKSVERQVLAEKKLEASRLRRKALTEKLTLEEKALLNSTKLVTAADYQNALADRNITKEKAKLLIAMNRENAELRQALINMEILTAEEAANAAMTSRLSLMWGRFTASLKRAGAAIKSFFAANWVMLAIGVVIEGIMELWNATDNTTDVLQGINTSAKETTESLENFKEKIEETVGGFKNLTKDTANKVWEQMREEIENSSAAATLIVQKLMAIDDVSKRVETGEEYLDNLIKINETLAETTGHVKYLVSNDWLYGLLGEGIESDLDDLNAFNATMRNLNKQVSEAKTSLGWLWAETKRHFYVGFDLMDWSGSREEAEKEITDFAESLKDELKNVLTPEELADSTMFNEALNRYIAEFKKANPKIQGEAEELFDQIINTQMTEFFPKTYNGTNYWINKIISESKRKASSEFQNLTDDIYSDTGSLSEQQILVFKKVWAQYRDDATQAEREAVDEIMRDLNSRDFRIRVGVEFGVVENDPDQKEAMKLLGINGPIDTKKEENQWKTTLVRKQGENFSAYTKRYNEIWNADLANLKTMRELYTAALKRTDDLAVEVQKQLKKDIDTLANRVKVEEEFAQKEGIKLTEKGSHKSGSKKDPLAEALKQELSLIREMQSNYDKLRKAGMDTTSALTVASSGYEESLKKINAVLKRFGIAAFKPSDFVGKDAADPNKLLNALRRQYENLLKSGKAKIASLKDLEVEIQKVNVSAREYNLKKVTDGLNSELGKIKEEYELAVTLDANPELGNMFGEMFNIDLSNLPHTFDDVWRRIQNMVNNKIDEFNKGLEKNQSVDYIYDIFKVDLDKWADENNIDKKSDFFTKLKDNQKYVKSTFQKTAGDFIKTWEQLVDKYGELEDKLLKISKNTAKELYDILKKRGTNDEIKQALDLVNKITISRDETEIARLTEELENIVKDIVENVPTDFSLFKAILNKDARDKAKAIWDDFTQSDFYTTTFDDMERVSSRAIEMILKQLDGLKNKVKEDPASMKALMSAYKKGRDQLESRAPFKMLISGLKELASATDKAKVAREKYNKLLKEGASKEEIAKAEKELANAESDVRSATVKTTNALQASSNALSNVANAFSQVAELLGIAEDSDIGQLIADMNKGFSLMASVLGVVATMAMLAQQSLGWLGWAMMALSALVGLFSWISGAGNRKIDRQIKESERNVKRLDNAYKDLEQTIKKSYGTAQLGAKRVAVANKELQLAELETQLRLEKSRRSKYYDQDKIDDLRGRIKDLRNEISDSIDEITSDMLGISSVGDAAENLVSSMIDAFKEGEDYMAKYSESFDEMIDNMIVKAIVSKVIGEKIQQMWDYVQSLADKRGATYSEQAKASASRISDIDKEIDELEKYNQVGFHNNLYKESHGGQTIDQRIAQLQREREQLEQDMASAESAYAKAVTPTPEDIFKARDMVGNWSDEVKTIFDAYMDAFGIKFGQDSETNLSSLQQGISQVSEQTANAVEAYLNSMSQQAYLRNDILTEIRNMMVGFNFDVQTASMSQILLQLQNNYILMQSIASFMENWTIPSGRGIRVELVN